MIRYLILKCSICFKDDNSDDHLPVSQADDKEDFLSLSEGEDEEEETEKSSLHLTSDSLSSELSEVLKNLNIRWQIASTVFSLPLTGFIVLF